MRNLALSRSAPRTPHRTRPQRTGLVADRCTAGDESADPPHRRRRGLPWGSAAADRRRLPRVVAGRSDPLLPGPARRRRHHRARAEGRGRPRRRSTTRSAHDPAYRDLAVAKDPDTGREHSAYYRIPRGADDLLARSKLIETVTALGGTMVTLIKEIGTDALFALQRVLEGEALRTGACVLRALPRRRSRGRRRPDRREGRPVARTLRAGRSRPVRAGRRHVRRRHRRAGREVPHVGDAERERDHRAADAGDGRRRRRLRRRVRGPAEHARTVDVRLAVLGR